MVETRFKVEITSLSFLVIYLIPPLVGSLELNQIEDRVKYNVENIWRKVDQIICLNSSNEMSKRWKCGNEVNAAEVNEVRCNYFCFLKIIFFWFKNVIFLLWKKDDQNLFLVKAIRFHYLCLHGGAIVIFFLNFYFHKLVLIQKFINVWRRCVCVWYGKMNLMNHIFE